MRRLKWERLCAYIYVPVSICTTINKRVRGLLCMSLLTQSGQAKGPRKLNMGMIVPQATGKAQTGWLWPATASTPYNYFAYPTVLSLQ